MTNDRRDAAEITLAEARPGADIMMRVLPPLDSPRDDVTYEQMRSRVRRVHWVTALAAALGFAAVTILSRLHPALHASPATVLAHLLGTDNSRYVGAACAPLGTVLTLIGFNRVALTRPRKRPKGWWRPGRLSRHAFEFALHEERVWREGSDRWSLPRRLAACLTIGALQALAIVLPFSLMLSTALLSGVFGVWYRHVARSGRETALVDTVALHWAYYVAASAVAAVVVPAVVLVTVLAR